MFHGFGRIIYPNGKSEIGWYQKNKRHGNSYAIKYEHGIIDKDSGWYEDDRKKGDFKQEDETFKYFEAKDCVDEMRFGPNDQIPQTPMINY